MNHKTYNFVFCLAGKGERFKKKGYTIPKFLLPLKDDKSILENSLKELNCNKLVNFFLICNDKDKKWHSDLVNIFNKFEYKFQIYFIPDSNGQAHSANIISKKIKNNSPLFFFNGDTIIKDRNLVEFSKKMLESNSLGLIDTFFSNEKHFSYIKERNNYVVEIKEKIVISNMASSGLYLFKDSRTYEKYYKKLSQYSRKEKFISEVYEKMLSEGKRISYSFSKDQKKTIILGTPEQYNSCLNDQT